MAGNPYLNYYTEQAGSGISGFEGIRYQRGGGFFGNLWSRALKPALKYLGNKALGAGSNIYSDFMSGNDIGESLKTRLKETGTSIGSDAISKALSLVQRGKGTKRKRKSISKSQFLPLLKKRKTKRKSKKRKTIKRTAKHQRADNFFF